MFVHAIKKVKDATFPIFRTDTNNQNQISWNVKGSGFFINSNGTFISVAHIFDHATPQTKFLFCGFLPDKLSNPPLEIIEIARDNNNDIFIGRVKLKTPKYLHFSKKTPDIGRSVCILGYPLAQLSVNPDNSLEVGGVRRYIQPSFILDTASLPTDNGSGLIRTHEGFLVRDIGLFGMSGGPVFDTGGTILGIQGSVTSPRTSQSGNRTLTVENAMVIRGNLILDFLKQRQIRLN